MNKELVLTPKYSRSERSKETQKRLDAAGYSFLEALQSKLDAGELRTTEEVLKYARQYVLLTGYKRMWKILHHVFIELAQEEG